jgi:hypothetical protein
MVVREVEQRKERRKYCSDNWFKKMVQGVEVFGCGCGCGWWMVDGGGVCGVCVSERSAERDVDKDNNWEKENKNLDGTKKMNEGLRA